LIVPYRIEGAAAEGWASGAHGGNIVGGAHPPWVDCEPLHQHISDSDSWRVQIAVVAKLAAGPAQKVEQKLCRDAGCPAVQMSGRLREPRRWAAAAMKLGFSQTETVRLFHSPKTASSALRSWRTVR